jgi:hypothetical protein
VTTHPYTLTSALQLINATLVLHKIEYLSSHNQGVWLQSRYVYASQIARMEKVSSVEAILEVVSTFITVVTACLASTFNWVLVA